MRSFALALIGAIILEGMIFYTLSYWLCSTQTNSHTVIRLQLAPARLPNKKVIPNKIVKPTALVKKAPQTPIPVKKVEKTKPITKQEKIKPKIIKPKIIKPALLPPKKVIVKKRITVKKRPNKAYKQKKRFNPYKNIDTKKHQSAIKIKSAPNAVAMPIAKAKLLSPVKASQIIPKSINPINLAENQIYLAKVARLLARRKRYPRLARKRGIEGKIIVSFKISSTGKTFDISIFKGKNTILLKAAKRLVLKSKLPKPPKTWNTQTLVNVPVNYKLTRRHF